MRQKRRPGEEPCALPKLDGVVIGTLAGFGESGAPLVDFPGNAAGAPVEARTTVALHQDAGGREVVLLFEGGDAARPICVGVLREAGTTLDVPLGGTVDARLDGERLVLTADKEIVLRCGKATIVLTREGKVLLRGAYLLSRSTGVNRIKGGSVQIN
jgi:hypothetical protein